MKGIDVLSRFRVMEREGEFSNPRSTSASSSHLKTIMKPSMQNLAMNLFRKSREKCQCHNKARVFGPPCFTATILFSMEVWVGKFSNKGYRIR